MRIRLPKNTLARREATEGLLGISPWLIGFLLFTAGPFVVSIVLSMTDWRIMIAPKFVGLQNYIQILTNDPNFWQSIRVTFT